MTIYYPDISGYEAGVNLAGLSVVMVKATEGIGYTNPDYYNAKTRAANEGAFFGAYHFLKQGNGSGQADYAFGVIGKGVPVMLDIEPEYNSSGVCISWPTIADAINFVKEFRAHGGLCFLLYLPRWYWVNLGSPSLSALASLGMLLVTSDYCAYSDTGPGWNGYGGMSVIVWQYSATGSLNGVRPVDWNAFKGTLVEFKAFVTTGATNSEPTLQNGDTGSAVITLQDRLNVWGAKITVDGSFGPATLAAVKAFQTKEKLTVDGIVGPATWADLNQTPTDGAYPPPASLKAWSVNLYVTWDAVTVAGKAVPSYTVQTLGPGGEVIHQEIVTATNVTLVSLSFGVAYTVRVWSNGGPVAPTASSFTVTL